MEKRSHIDFMTLYVGNFTLMIGFSIWRNLFNNFAVEEVGVSAAQIGMIQAIREVPGFMGFAVALTAMFISELRLTFLSVVLLGLGLALTSFVEGFWGLVAACFLMSIGFHFFYTLRTAITLKLLDSSRATYMLARYRSHAQLAGAVTTGVVTVSFWLIDWMPIDIGMKHFYLIGGIAVMLVGCYLMFTNDPTLTTVSEKKLNYKKRYWLYYVLQFLSGARRHIFTTFAIFLLVKIHQVSVKEITLLIFVNSVLSYLVYKKAGDIIYYFGERSVLLILYILLIAIFLGYAYIDNLWLLFLLFIADHILFGFNLALDTYFKKTALPADITSNISAGVTINHISAIMIPVIGGVIWDAIGFETTFLFGAAVAFVSFLFCLKLQRHPEAIEQNTQYETLKI
jgi:MFS family permease